MKTKNSKAMLICSVFNVIILLLTLLFGENIWRQVHEHEQSVDDLLQEAEQAFISEDYLSALEIYLDDSLKRNPIALNNLGYMLVTGTGAAKDIKSGCEHYRQSAKLGNTTALDNYILSKLLYPTTYDELLEALSWGHNEDRPIVETFVEITSLSPQIVNQYGNMDPSEFWENYDISWRTWLKLITVESDDVIDPDILDAGHADFIGERCSRKVKERIGYKTITTSDGLTVLEEVYGLITQLSYKTYRLQYADFLDAQQVFIYL